MNERPLVNYWYASRSGTRSKDCATPSAYKRGNPDLDVSRLLTFTTFTSVRADPLAALGSADYFPRLLAACHGDCSKIFSFDQLHGRYV